MFPNKIKFVSKPVTLVFPDDSDESKKNDFIKSHFYSVDQTLNAPHNIAFGHIRSDLSTLLQARDASEFLAIISKLQMSTSSTGFTADTPVDVIYRSIVPANCQTPSELQNFSRIYADKIAPVLRARAAKKENVSEKIDFSSNKDD